MVSCPLLKGVKRDTNRYTAAPKSGFTLIEVIAVLVLLGILAAVAVPKYVNMVGSAHERAIDAGIAELNARESLTWAKETMTVDGWSSDAVIYDLVDRELGSAYTYSVAGSVNGATLRFQGSPGVALTRTASTESSGGSWKRD